MAWRLLSSALERILGVMLWIRPLKHNPMAQGTNNRWVWQIWRRILIVLVDFIDAALASQALGWMFSVLPVFYFRAPGFRPAFVMDGNRRFAMLHGLGNTKKVGFNKMVEVLIHCRGMGIREASFFVLSKKNLGRPQKELEDARKLLGDFAEMGKSGIRIRVFGQTDLLERSLSQHLDEIVEKTRKNSGVTVNLFVAYSSDCDFQGTVDVLVRTGNTQRLSDFLLRQVSKGAHITFLKCFWPEITYFHILLVYWKFLLEKEILRTKAD